MSIQYTATNIIISDESDPSRKPLTLPRNTSPEEVEAAALAYLPQPPLNPDWLGFASWLYGFPPIAAAMIVARAATEPQGEPAATALPAAMDEARLRGNYFAFAVSWSVFIAASAMPASDLAQIVAKAEDCHLPAEFVAALQPTN